MGRPIGEAISRTTGTATRPRRAVNDRLSRTVAGRETMILPIGRTNERLRTIQRMWPATGRKRSGVASRRKVPGVKRTPIPKPTSLRATPSITQSDGMISHPWEMQHRPMTLNLGRRCVAVAQVRATNQVSRGPTQFMKDLR